MDILSITFVACFPSLTIEILEAGIFDGPQIWKLLKDTEIKEVMTDSEAMAWETSAYVVMNFLGNHKSENYVEMVYKLIDTFYTLGANMNQASVPTTVIWIGLQRTWVA